MLDCKCIRKYFDKNGVIIGYLLVDAKGETVQVKQNVLKNLIRMGKVDVLNLTLTSDNRLIDAAKPKEKASTVQNTQKEDTYKEVLRKQEEYRQKKNKLEMIMINILCKVLLDENRTTSIIQNSKEFRWKKASQIQIMKRNGKPYSGELIEKYKKAYEAYLNLLKEHNDIKIWPMDIFGNIEGMLLEKMGVQLYEMIKPDGLIDGPVKFYQKVSCNRQIIVRDFTNEMENILEDCIYDIISEFYSKRGVNLNEYEVVNMLNAPKVIEVIKEHEQNRVPKVKGLTHEDLLKCIDNALENLKKRYSLGGH